MGVLRRAKLRRRTQCANQLWRPLGRDRSIHAQAKKRQLEAERALLVQEQVQSACERIKEFQAHFACLPADVFVKLGKLRAHESLHDSLYVSVWKSKFYGVFRVDLHAIDAGTRRTG